MTASTGTMNVQEELLREVIDPHLTDEVLSAFSTEALGIRTRCDGYSVLTGGCWNRVIAVSTDGAGKGFVLKITPKIGAAALDREFQVLQHFHACTAMPVPEPFLVDLTGERVPGSVLVMERVPGTVMSEVNQRLDDEERRILAEEIADHVVDLHVRQESGFGGLELPAEERSATWLDFWVPRFDEAIAESQEKGLMADDVLAGIGELRGHLPQLLDIGPRGALTHHDVWMGNVMVDYQGGRHRVSGFLDVTGFYADYARELTAMFSLADERFMKVYERRHGLDESFRARFDLYSLKMCLLLSSMYPSSDYMSHARRHLRQVQAYLESH